MRTTRTAAPTARFAGANFPFLAANVKYAGTDKTVLPPYWVKNFNGAKIGFIGMTLKDTPDIVTQSGIAGLEFTDEVATANALVPVLREQGVKAIVVLLHQGGYPEAGLVHRAVRCRLHRPRVAVRLHLPGRWHPGG